MWLRQLITHVSLFSVLAAPAAGVAQQASVDERCVLQAIDRLNGAYLQRDGKIYESLTTSDFVRVTPNGRAYGLADWLKTVVAPGVPRLPPVLNNVSVHVYGSAAVVTY